MKSLVQEQHTTTIARFNSTRNNKLRGLWGARSYCKPHRVSNPLSLAWLRGAALCNMPRKRSTARRSLSSRMWKIASRTAGVTLDLAAVFVSQCLSSSLAASSSASSIGLLMKKLWLAQRTQLPHVDQPHRDFAPTKHQTLAASTGGRLRGQTRTHDDTGGTRQCSLGPLVVH